jgi:hypothetical protein
MDRTIGIGTLIVLRSDPIRGMPSMQTIHKRASRVSTGEHSCMAGGDLENLVFSRALDVARTGNMRPLDLILGAVAEAE